MQCTIQADVDLLLPVLRSRFHKSLVLDVTGIVDQYVDCPKIRLNSGDHGLDLFVVADIGLVAFRFSAGRLNGLDNSFRLGLGATIVNCNNGTFSGECPGDITSNISSAT